MQPSGTPRKNHPLRSARKTTPAFHFTRLAVLLINSCPPESSSTPTKVLEVTKRQVLTMLLSVLQRNLQKFEGLLNTKIITPSLKLNWENVIILIP